MANLTHLKKNNLWCPKCNKQSCMEKVFNYMTNSKGLQQQLTQYIGFTVYEDRQYQTPAEKAVELSRQITQFYKEQIYIYQLERHTVKERTSMQFMNKLHDILNEMTDKGQI